MDTVTFTEHEVDCVGHESLHAELRQNIDTLDGSLEVTLEKFVNVSAAHGDAAGCGNK